MSQHPIKRSVFVSGGASGIGLATARHFAERDWRVGIGDVDLAGLASAKRAFRLETFELDVRDPAQWDRVLNDFCSDAAEGLDVLVNNAGVLKYGWFDEHQPGDFELSVDVNIKGVLYGARAGIDRLKRVAGSCLVNMASTAALAATPKQALYSATKFAVRGLSEALDIEFMRLGVRVACIEPFLVDTPMLDKDDDRGRSYRTVMQGLGFLSASDVASAVWDAAHGHALHYPVGEAPKVVADLLVGEVEARRTYWRKLMKLKHSKEES